MRLLLLCVFTLVLLSGCSRTTAFDLFRMDKAHERAVDNMQTGTIVRSFETEAILSAIYLNPVYPDKYNDGEYFYIALYTRENVRLYFKSGLNNKKYTFTCNGEEPLETTELKTDDELRLLMPITNEWNRYYLVKFAPQHLTTLDLLLENDQSGLVHLSYHKDLE